MTSVLLDDWHEAAYILNIKERYVMSQLAVDQVVDCTKNFVSVILSGILNDVKTSLPHAAIQLLQSKIDDVDTALFKQLSSAALQKKYFKKYFNLVVSHYLEIEA